MKITDADEDIKAQARAELERARELEAARADAALAARDVAALRLFSLKQEIRPYVEAMPEARAFIDLTLSPQYPPRLWIDMTSFVIMSEDGRAWRLMQDTAEGREKLFETRSLDDMSAFLRRFIAHRVVQRQKLLAAQTSAPEPEKEETSSGPAAPEGAGDAATLWLVWLAGILSGALALLAWLVHAGRL